LAGKQAKVLSSAQIRMVLSYLSETRNSERDTVLFLLSVRAGLRACEIAGVNWLMFMSSTGEIGEVLELEDRISKMGSGRTIPLSVDLRAALKLLHARVNPLPSDTVAYSERKSALSAATVTQRFFHLYRRMGMVGCSSHSGRRTFITQGARKIGLVGGSLRDIQLLAGHADLSTTSSYIDADTQAARKLVNII
jgi:integrase